MVGQWSGEEVRQKSVPILFRRMICKKHMRRTMAQVFAMLCAAAFKGWKHAIVATKLVTKKCVV
eukprot:6465755-Lingulodinium_polyedra.AAC.1